MKAVFFMAGVCFALGACAASPLPENPVLLKARQAENMAAQAQSRGQYDRAAEHWNQAVLRYDALADPVGFGRAAVGLSRALVDSGRRTEALANLNVSLSRAEELPTDIQIELLARRGGIHLQNPETLDKAGSDLLQADALCASRCRFSAALHGLQARLAIVQGRMAEARLHVQSGLLALASQESAQRVERANLGRLFALIQMKEGQYELAHQSAEAALEIDRNLGLPDRIVMDLELLASIAKLQKQPAQASQFEEQARRAKAALLQLQGRAQP
ncbi:MAG: hypothetical protein O9274_05695 [Limnobacter sp.]|uniref:hypothetical protein n=1 Tax=Limnobacter sp. TaxID=2003368 RepID=UPI0022C7451C|nr:hypothetical protein [Limnobacter sp.]MCZ8015172.1 hypothetical protein [Limnobacter sp.]